MKQFFKHTLMACMTFAATTATAAEWTKPVPAASEVASGTTYYLYNEGYSMFINQGEAWGTQAIVAKEGLAAKVDNISDGVYTITFLKTSKGDNKQFFRSSTDPKIGNGVKGAFVDGGGKAAEAINWSVTAYGDGTYVIGLPTDNSAYVSGEALGVDTEHAGSVSPTYGTYWDIPVGNDNTKWRFVSEADYAAYFVALDTYDLALLLAEEIEKAKEEGLDVTKAEAVYANTESTKEQVQAAIDDLYLQRSMKGSVDNPADVTGKIANPNFDTDTKGWTSTTGAGSNKIASNQQGDFTVPFYENWNPKEKPLKGMMYQKLTGLPSGVYLLRAAVSAQSQATAMCENGTYLFGNDIMVPVTSVEPVYMQTFVPVDADTLSLGLYMSEDNKNNWVGIDNVSLAYYGGTIESYQHMATHFDNWKESIDGMTVTQSIITMVDEQVAIIASATEASAAIEAFKKASAGINDAYANAAAYEKLQSAVDYANYDAELDYQPLTDYIAECENMISEATATTEELLAAYKRIYELIDEGRRSQMKPGDDATALILNADFTESTADVPYSGFGNWTITGTNNFASNGKPNTQSGVAEVWVNAFELSQKVEGLQNGVYKLSTQAYYRYPEKNGDPYADYVAGNVKDVEIASLFINDSEQGLPNVFSGRQTVSMGVNERIDADGGYTPNDKASAAKYFENNLYPVEVCGVVTDGTMTLGIHGKNDNHWVLWGAFKLEFEGKDAKVLTDVLGKAIAEYGSLAEQPQGNGPKSALVATLDEARTALSSGNGDAMFAAYTKLMNDAKESKTSIDAYADLVVANGVLANTIDLYQDDADATLLREAIDLNSTVTTALNNGTYGNEEAMAKVAEVRKAIVTLKASAANDENPVDMTEVIVNPDFANNNADGWTVDAGTAKCGVQNTVFEGYSGAFDIHQVITGVPQGTYKISAKGFYRRGNSENANNCYLNDTTIIAASLYGNGADSIAMQNIVYVDDIAQNAGTGSWKSITINDAEYFYPNDRATARNRFDNELYENELFTCVGEDGILVIGMRNTNPLAEDWSAVSNFRLTCYGKNSKYAESTGISDINAANAKTVEIYNVNGMRVNAPVKGINILKIEANGKTVTKKVVIK